MKKLELNLGDKLLAIDECKMSGNRKATLTVGEYYEIVSLNKKEVCIIDDNDDEHFFTIKDIGRYLLTPYVINKISDKLK